MYVRFRNYGVNVRQHQMSNINLPINFANSCVNIRFLKIPFNIDIYVDKLENRIIKSYAHLSNCSFMVTSLVNTSIQFVVYILFLNNKQSLLQYLSSHKHANPIMKRKNFFSRKLRLSNTHVQQTSFFCKAYPFQSHAKLKYLSQESVWYQ